MSSRFDRIPRACNPQFGIELVGEGIDPACPPFIVPSEQSDILHAADRFEKMCLLFCGVDDLFRRCFPEGPEHHPA
jgi:hypothetical protein